MSASAAKSRRDGPMANQNSRCGRWGILADNVDPVTAAVAHVCGTHEPGHHI